jgi:hypothetical protein
MCMSLTRSCTRTPLGISNDAQVERWWGLVLSGRVNDLAASYSRGCTNWQNNLNHFQPLSLRTQSTEEENQSGPLQYSLPDARRRSACFQPHLLPSFFMVSTTVDSTQEDHDCGDGDAMYLPNVFLHQLKLLHLRLPRGWWWRLRKTCGGHDCA